jgi:hypothetical protein
MLGYNLEYILNYLLLRINPLRQALYHNNLIQYRSLRFGLAMNLLEYILRQLFHIAAEILHEVKCLH